MPALSVEEVKANFANSNLEVFTDNQSLKTFLLSKRWRGSNLLMMSSGTFDGLDFKELSSQILS
jgi:UDP-N-acetylmuramate: L-alanyl-gamma-D-glutamyl-meso-diaminopimelate ligase